MSKKTIGIDLGTNSLGITVRNPDLGRNIVEQLEYYTSIIFPSGVGTGKSGEYSYAAERTKHRSTRRLYQSRKYRIWATLRLLIAHGCCPLKEEELDRWARYDKEKGLKRQYPVDARVFEQWVRLDFNCDGMPEYSSPYQLRAELMERELDWDNPVDRYKFGRAMYHIAQRRGFKSSKGETLKESKEDADVDTMDISGEMKKSEEKKSKTLQAYMDEHKLPTAGCAFAQLEREGVRVRNSEYQAVQRLYRKEVDDICKQQHIDEIDPELYQGLMSTKKGEGTIFYRRPLRSQKGLVGKCTLEPTRRRCPVSHPDFEEYRALSFINNIKYRLSPDKEWKTLTDEERNGLFNEKFTRANATFKFEDIRKWIEDKHSGVHLDYDARTINYRDHTTVAGCPVISRMKKILGEHWRTEIIATNNTRTNYQTGEVHATNYNYEDIWHLAFSSDDYEELAEFAQNRMGLNSDQRGHLTRLWSAIQEGYASLSLKAIRNILPFLRQGIIYSEAVAVAKIPDIIGHDRWEQQGESIMESLRNRTKENEYCRMVYSIANTLIANYRTRIIDNPVSRHDTDYKLDDADKADVQHCIIDTLSTKRWNKLSPEEQDGLQHEVERLYQDFFATSKRDYYKLPRQSDMMKEYLASTFPEIPEKQWDKLYHHSQIDLFPQQKPQTIEEDGRMMYVCQLGTPDIGSIRNPVALRALHVLRHAINALLRQGIIDETTRVVVETARDMNDANKRKAIELYQKARKKENDAIVEIIKEFRPNYTDADIEKGRLLFEQNIVPQSTRPEKEKAEKFALDMQKYTLWKEQKFRCLYTGKSISLSDLFTDGRVDIEHTIPRSISFDNSLTNRTVCDAHFNRFEKSNRIPSELSNYDDIKDRIKPWEERVAHIKAQIELWKGKNKAATTMERKNECMQQRHLWEMELDYWQTKLRTFTIQKDDLDLGFRNSQLVDTRIITKYAFHYLKSVFARVDVQKGSVTAEFRKILGIQSTDEKKDRDKHSHHAIDAAVLTLIPTAAQRDRMLELFHKKEEVDDMEKGAIQLKLDKEIDSCRVGSADKLVDTIEQNILVNHVSKDQTLTPAKKPRRNGRHKIKGQWMQGDSIRGSLHQDTFYGAIATDDEKKRMVVRKPLKGLAEKDLPSIVDPAVHNAIETQVNQYMADENISFAKAIEKDIYMLDSKGTPITHDKNGRPIRPIRHVRCYAKAGRGELGYDTVLKIKRQTYLSKHDYKNLYYVQNDDNYLCLYYEGYAKGKFQRAFRLVNYFDIAQLHPESVNALVAEPEFAIFEKNERMPLKAIIKKGTRVLLYNNIANEVHDLDRDELSKRLYIVYKFNAMGTPNVYLKHHLEARKENECDNKDSYLSLKASNFKALIEHYDFEVDTLGNIIFN